MKKLKEEFFKILPPTIYFFIALHIVAFVRVLMLKGTGISPSTSISIAVLALILGKAVLIADMLPFINRFPKRPLVYNIAWKTLIYVLVSALIHYLGRLYDFARQAGGIAGKRQRVDLSFLPGLRFHSLLGGPGLSGIRCHWHRQFRRSEFPCADHRGLGGGTSPMGLLAARHTPKARSKAGVNPFS